MHFSASVAALLFALPACLAAAIEPRILPDQTAMLSYVFKDSNNDLYYLCAGSGGNPTAVYRKTGKVEPGCVFKSTMTTFGWTLESTFAKGTYLGRHGTDTLSLGDVDVEYWNTLMFQSTDLKVENAKSVYQTLLGIHLLKTPMDLNPWEYHLLPGVNATLGDNQVVKVITKKSTEKPVFPNIYEINWGLEDPTAANNPK